MLDITPEERVTLQLLADGKEASEIAVRLRVPESHIDELLTTLFERLGVTSRTGAVAAAAQRGLAVVDAALHAAPSRFPVDIVFEDMPMRLRVQAVAKERSR